MVRARAGRRSGGRVVSGPVAGRPSRVLLPTLVFVGLVVAAVGSLGAPLVPTVARQLHVSLAAAQWTLTLTLLTGAVTMPVLGRLGDGPRRRQVILTTLGVVLLGSILTTLPLGFGSLLVGRGLQGAGLGLTSLVIAVARDAFDGQRAGAVIGLLSVTSVAGIGVGYPVAGVLTEYAGLRAAYGAGAAVTGAALVLAALVLPRGRPRPQVRLDVAGAVLLGAALSGLLYAISEATASGVAAWLLLCLAGASLLLGAVWVRHELRTTDPLVDLHLIRIPAVLAADVTVLLGGVGMYLLLSLATRFVQAPTSTGYGFGSSVVVAGLVLVPFSAMSFLASRTVPAAIRRVPDGLAAPASCAIVLLASLGFAVARGHLWEVFFVMGVAGYGVGSVFATVPTLIVRAVPAAVTSSAISFNQVLRTIGFAAGSALAGLVLQAATPAGQALPADSGYTVAALLGAGVLLITIIVTVVLRPRTPAADETLAPMA